ncbi:hypothetical protein LZC95_37950 [Pendulispora brunnea]|uniref:Uncharacterized protein n=1 Tax=Pendulispora brunnea TaxID=2905690 RepID=A0ABZ2K4T0_9BACT
MQQEQDSVRSIRILAKSVFRRLQGEGYERVQLIQFASELVGLIGSKEPPPSSDDDSPLSEGHSPERAHVSGAPDAT